MFVFRKIWRALFSWNTRLRFALLPYYRRFRSQNLENRCCKKLKKILNSFKKEIRKGVPQNWGGGGGGHWGEGEKQKIVQIVVFPIIFVTDCLKKSKNFKCDILLLIVLNLLLHHYGISINNLWNPNKQLKCLGKGDKFFIFRIFFR